MFCKCLGCLMLLMALLSTAAQGQSVEEFDSTSPHTPRVKPPSTQEASQADLTKVAEMIVEQTNAFRKKHELRSLEVDPKLTETAQYFADFMARTKKYGHHADEQTPAERADQHGYEYCIVLENIGYAARSNGFESKELTSKFVEGWKNSEGHRENMLDPDIYETGVAIARSEDDPQYFAVQMFGRPHSKAIRFQITNRAGEEIEYEISRKNNERSFKLPPRATRTHTQCRPSNLDLGWTKEEDKLQTSDGLQFNVTKTEGQGFEIQASKSDRIVKPTE